MGHNDQSKFKPILAATLTITTGGVAQEVFPAKEHRHLLFIQNQSTGNLYVRADGTAATADENSIRILPDQTYEEEMPGMVSPTSISIIGATTGQAFYAEER